jgi:hypothetical protein
MCVSRFPQVRRRSGAAEKVSVPCWPLEFGESGTR